MWMIPHPARAGTPDLARENRPVLALARAGAMVLLSDYEAHPVAVMEALALGRPAVVARTSGLTELEELGWALGVDVDASAEETALAIERQLEDPVRPEVAVLPTWETSVAGVVDVYESVLAR